MNPLLGLLGSLFTPIDLAAFATGLPAKIEKDEARMRLFGMAAVKKTAEIAAAVAANAIRPAAAPIDAAQDAAPAPTFATVLVSGLPVEASAETVREFGEDLADVLAEYERDAQGMAPKKWSLASLFGGSDPFAPGRQKVRDFAHKWSLDPAFVEAMG